MTWRSLIAFHTNWITYLSYLQLQKTLVFDYCWCVSRCTVRTSYILLTKTLFLEYTFKNNKHFDQLHLCKWILIFWNLRCTVRTHYNVIYRNALSRLGILINYILASGSWSFETLAESRPMKNSLKSGIYFTVNASLLTIDACRSDSVQYNANLRNTFSRTIGMMIKWIYSMIST